MKFLTFKCEDVKFIYCDKNSSQNMKINKASKLDGTINAPISKNTKKLKPKICFLIEKNRSS